MAPRVRLIGAASAVLALLSLPAMAQQAPPVVVMPPLEITATPLLPGLPDLTKAPAAAQVFNRRDITRDGYPGLLRTLDEMGGGVSLDQAQGNPWQPNLVYRGFEASPLGGNAQGLAIYVNGSRFNQPFGDTVNWDLIPDIAMDRIDLVSSNPAFGLNALGGALAVRMKDGFTWQGAEAELLGGSFGRIQGSFQYGIQSENTSAYVAGTLMHESGWRDFSPSTLRQIYGDIGWRGEQAELHLNIIGADNDLVGNGTTPVGLLRVNRDAVFTHPDDTKNNYVRVGLAGTYTVNDSTTIQVNAYYSNLSQRTLNGDGGDVQPCPARVFLCFDDGTRATDTSGLRIPNFIRNSPYLTEFNFVRFRAGGPYAFLNQTATDTNGYGMQGQMEYKSSLLEMPNRVTVGASYDGGSTGFRASTQVGALSLDRGFIGPGIVISQADGAITPVNVHSSNNYFGLYMTDTLDITPKLSGTVSARFNSAQITLQDQIGTDLTGSHSYNHLNPAIGFTYQILPSLTAYAGYAMTNRAPTPAELSCADASAPCSLTNFFVGDPNLNQVVAQTVEAGLRGNLDISEGSKLDWNVGFFRTVSNDDILFVSSDISGRAFFRNVGQTRRQGVEVGVRYRSDRLSAYANYAFTDATFQSPFTLSSENNPAADPDGNINVQPGNRLPGVARQLFKVGADYGITESWVIGFSATIASGKYLVGDESNLNPTTGAYGILNIHSNYQITKNVQVFALMENLFDTTYATFGTFSPIGFNTPFIEARGSTNTRSLSLAPPFSAFGGLRVSF